MEKRHLLSACLAVGILLLFVVFSMFSASTVNVFIDDEEMKADVDHSFPIDEIIRKKRFPVEAIAIGIALTDFAVGNIRQSFDNIEAEKSHDELMALFEQIQKELEQHKEELQLINQEIKKLGVSVVYFQHESKISDSLLTLREYLENPSDRNRNIFIEKAADLTQSIRVLIDGLLGQSNFGPDILAIIRDATNCHGRQFRKNVKSIESLIMTGLYVRGEYQRLTNATEFSGSLSYFGEFIYSSLIKLSKRLNHMVIECQDEKNVSDDMRKFMEATLTIDSKATADLLLEFLKGKYDTKTWIAIMMKDNWVCSEESQMPHWDFWMKKQSWDRYGNRRTVHMDGKLSSSTWTDKFHSARVQNYIALAISVDGQENFTETRHLIETHLARFCTAEPIDEHLNRFLTPVRAISQFEMESFWNGWGSDEVTIAASKGAEYARNYPMTSSRCQNRLVIVIPTRKISFNNQSSSTRSQKKCHYNFTNASESYGPLRNEHGQSYLSVQGNSTEEGASIVVEREWKNSPGQKWKFVDGQLRNEFGKCLTAWKSSSWFLYQYDCRPDWTGQKWYRNGFQIINHDDTLCLSFQDEVHKDPMYVIQNYCDPSRPFIWYNWNTDCEDAVVIPPSANESRFIRNEFSRLFMSVASFGFAFNGNHLRNGDKYGAEDPWSSRRKNYWRFVGGMLKNDDGKCLAGKGWYVELVKCADESSQRWTYNEKRQIISNEGYCLSTGFVKNLLSSFRNDLYTSAYYVLYNYCKDEPRFRWRLY